MCLVERVSVNKTTIPLINISIFHVSMGILGGGGRRTYVFVPRAEFLV